MFRKQAGAAEVMLNKTVQTGTVLSSAIRPFYRQTTTGKGGRINAIAKTPADLR